MNIFVKLVKIISALAICYSAYMESQDKVLSAILDFLFIIYCEVRNERTAQTV